MTNARALLDADLKEKPWQDCVMSLLRAHNWLCYHTYDSRRSTPGFPDIVAVRDRRVLFIELKTETGKVSPAQQEWLTALDATDHVESHLWRPRDWDTIERVVR